MGGFQKPYKGIRQVLFESLKQPDAVDNYYCAEQVTEICNLAVGLPGGIDKDIIGRAFSCGESQYSLQFSDIFDDVDCGDTLHVFISRHFGGADDVRITAIGRFTSEAKRLEAQHRLIVNENRCSFRQWSFDTVGSSAKEAFHAYVETRKQKRPKQLCQLLKK